MKLNLPGVVLIFAGAILLLAAFQKKDPRNIILEGIGSKRRVTEPSGPSPAPPAPPAPSIPDPGATPIPMPPGWVSV